MTVKLAVLANGYWDNKWGKTELERVDQLICADGGGNSALACGRLPDALIGDLDSITPENLARCLAGGVKIEQYPTEKDQTDLELALAWADALPGVLPDDEIMLYGATGKRVDHFLGNVSLLLAYARKGRRVRIKDPQHEMWVLHGKEIITGGDGEEISLIPLSDTAIVTTEGFYYPLQQEKIFQDSPRAISNVLVEKTGTIEVADGWVLIIKVKKDEADV